MTEKRAQCSMAKPYLFLLCQTKKKIPGLSALKYTLFSLQLLIQSKMKVKDIKKELISAT